MGSGTSRLAEHRPKNNKFKRRLSTCICGSSSSRHTVETEDDSVESWVNSAGYNYSVSTVSQALPKEPVYSSSGGCLSESRSSHLKNGATTSSSFSGEQSSRDVSSDLLSANNSINDRAGIEGAGDAETGITDSSSVVPPAVFTSNIVSQSLEDDITQELMMPSGLGIPILDSVQDSNEGNVLHVDVMTISSGNSSGSSNQISTRELRRNTRRMFWDAFSGRGSRRHADFPSILFASDDSDNVDSGRSWLLDFGSDIFDNGISNDLWNPVRRRRVPGERRWHSRSELWERLRGGTNERRRSNICPSGLHPDGSCLCGLEDGADNQTSMSRIVMLAEALFEVLDELHRQPASSFGLPMLSNPAPESTVDSLPIKFYEKSTVFESGDDVEQCYICLEEYEAGDKIRVLPCTHEYHTTCVDKWLKEIHGICPLCRGDVSQGTTEDSLPDSGVPSAPVNFG